MELSYRFMEFPNYKVPANVVQLLTEYIGYVSSLYTLEAFLTVFWMLCASRS